MGLLCSTALNPLPRPLQLAPPSDLPVSGPMHGTVFPESPWPVRKLFQEAAEVLAATMTSDLQEAPPVEADRGAVGNWITIHGSLFPASS